MKKIIEYLYLCAKLILLYSLSSLLFAISLFITLWLFAHLITETFYNPSLWIIILDSIAIAGAVYLVRSDRFRKSIKELFNQLKSNK